MAPRRYSPRLLIGRHITAIARVFYEHQGALDEGDGALEVTLDGECVLFDAESDGDALRVRETEWRDPFEEPLSDENRSFVEEHGRWRRVDCSLVDPYAVMCGQIVTDACSLVNEFSRVAGVRISVAAGSMWFAVQGDESRVYWAQPIGFTESPSQT